MFRIVFVLDLYNHNAVHAKGGDRKKYLPVHENSLICTTSDPLEIVNAIKPREIYMADLNRLQGIGDSNVNNDIFYSLSGLTQTMLDPGISDFCDIQDFIPLCDHPILGTETTSLEMIKKAAKMYPSTLNVSIDKKDGRILTTDSTMPEDPLEIIRILNGLNINDIIFLDLDMVGTSGGFDEPLLRDMVSASRHNILLGGGVKDLDDIDMLNNIGVKGALVATALHNGSIPATMLSGSIDQ